jgi:hypothetical protein
MVLRKLFPLFVVALCLAAPGLAAPAFAQYDASASQQDNGSGDPESRAAAGSAAALATGTDDQSKIGGHSSMPSPTDDTGTVQAPATRPVEAAPSAPQESSTPTPSPVAQPSDRIINLEGDNLDKSKSEQQDALRLLAGVPPDMRAEVESEANKMQGYCEDNYMLHNFYDCSCFALGFAKQRILAGPDIDYTQLISKGNYEACVSQPAIAGYTYQRCYSVIYLNKVSNRYIKDVCGCVARNVAREFAKTPRMDMNFVDGIFNDNYGSCNQKFGNHM